jgi:hypothetical protein
MELGIENGDRAAKKKKKKKKDKKPQEPEVHAFTSCSVRSTSISSTKISPSRGCENCANT